jgi:hypothetical protein
MSRGGKLTKAQVTEAQMSYLLVAASRPIAFVEIKSSPSVRCVNLLAREGLLRRDVDGAVWRITPAGRSALESQKP